MECEHCQEVDIPHRSTLLDLQGVARPEAEAAHDGGHVKMVIAVSMSARGVFLVNPHRLTLLNLRGVA
jgi:hypothetical protein